MYHKKFYPNYLKKTSWNPLAMLSLVNPWRRIEDRPTEVIRKSASNKPQLVMCVDQIYEAKENIFKTVSNCYKGKSGSCEYLIAADMSIK